MGLFCKSNKTTEYYCITIHQLIDRHSSSWQKRPDVRTCNAQAEPTLIFYSYSYAWAAIEHWVWARLFARGDTNQFQIRWSALDWNRELTKIILYFSHYSHYSECAESLMPLPLSSSGPGQGRMKVRCRSGEGQEGQSQVCVVWT